MSAFDDEFGLFGDEVGEDEERRSTLGARQIGTGETIIDDIEPEDADSSHGGGRGQTERRGRTPRVRREGRGSSSVAQGPALDRARDLLAFLAKRLVSKPEAVVVELDTEDERGPILDLEVDHADLGKVIGRSGRVAQALRTLVRASAEGRLTIEIVDAENIDSHALEDGGEEEDVDGLASSSTENAEG